MNYKITTTSASLGIIGSTFVDTKEEAITQFMKWAQRMVVGDLVSIECCLPPEEESA